jgi:hypothetical protein
MIIADISHRNSGFTNIPRIQLLIVLHAVNVLDSNLIGHVFELASQFKGPKDTPLPPLEDFLAYFPTLSDGGEKKEK